MDLPKFPQMYNPFSPQHEITSTHHHHLLIPQNDIVSQLGDLNYNYNHNTLDNLLQIPSTLLIQNDDDVSNTKQRKASMVIDDDGDYLNPKETTKKKKKIVHREIERQRRFEMSSLHSSLRALLPHDYIKGKRAISDHLGEAVKYISHLQQNMKELQVHRDSLKTEVYLKTSKTRDRDVKVELCKGGVDVVVSTSYGVNGDDNEVGIPLSKVIQCLSQHRLDVVTCVSHRVNNSKMVHSIQAQYVAAEDEDGKSVGIDPAKLQERLKNL